MALTRVAAAVAAVAKTLALMRPGPGPASPKCFLDLAVPSLQSGHGRCSEGEEEGIEGVRASIESYLAKFTQGVAKKEAAIIQARRGPCLPWTHVPV